MSPCSWKQCDQSFTQRAVLTALRTDITLDPKRLAVIGGSHGGFLSCHLVGQYPDFYRACAARNPVINAATLLGTSDIVDWWDMCTLHNSSSTDTWMQHIPTIFKVRVFHPLCLSVSVCRRYSSVGLQYSYDQIPTAEALAAMLEKSPITHAAQVRHTRRLITYLI